VPANKLKVYKNKDIHRLKNISLSKIVEIKVLSMITYWKSITCFKRLWI